MMEVRLSGLRTDRALLPGNIILPLFILILLEIDKLLDLVRLEGLCKLEKINSLMGSRTCDLPGCSIMP
jgi:hypothetical protein